MQLLSGERGSQGADEVQLDVLRRELNLSAPDTGWPRDMVDAQASLNPVKKFGVSRAAGPHPRPGVSNVSRRFRLSGAHIALAVLAACSPAVYTGGGTATPTVNRPPSWPVVTRSHVDLWLHGYAMLLRDTATVPVFRRGYRERVRTLKAQRNLTTLLDANRERLQARLVLSPNLVNGQFLPMYFASWDQMQQVIKLFLQANGNPQAATDRTLAQYFAVLAQSCPAAADREWLRIYTESMEDERRKFFQEFWTLEHAARLAQVRAVDSLWQGGLRLRMQRFMNNTQQEAGDFVLAITLGGEGRTVNFASRQNAIATTMPDSEPNDAFYVLAHEAVSSLVVSAVNDNTTPSEQRAGLAAQFITAGAVRGGAMLLQRVAPELVAGYIRYYLMQAGQPHTGDVTARFETVFALPDLVRQALSRQLEVVLGGL